MPTSPPYLSRDQVHGFPEHPVVNYPCGCSHSLQGGPAPAFCGLHGKPISGAEPEVSAILPDQAPEAAKAPDSSPRDATDAEIAAADRADLKHEQDLEDRAEDKAASQEA
jgi:hypothetical protein